MVNRTFAQADLAGYQPTSRPIWLEALFPLDWVALHASPVYYGFGVPRGHGEPVILVPGFLGDDRYLTEMHLWLRRIGYRPYFSGIGRNVDCPELLTQRLLMTIDAAYEETHQKVTIVGHSLGGMLARAAAHREADKVKQVITMGSPFRSVARAPAGAERRELRAVEHRARPQGPPRGDEQLLHAGVHLRLRHDAEE